MATTNARKKQYFCIFDYYLDGVFLKWETVKGECPVLAHGKELSVNLEDGTQVTGKFIDTKPLSENERQIFLSSQ